MFYRKLPDGIHGSHFSVLNHLVRLGDGKTPLEISRAFQVTKGTITNTLGELEKRRFVSLAPNPNDGRSKCVFVTDEGRAFRQNAIASLGPAIAQLSELLDLDKMAELLPEMARIRAVLDDNRDV